MMHTFTAPVSRPQLRGRAAIERMADDMRVISAAHNGAATETDLAVAGWTPTQIAIHANSARAKAQALAGV